MTPTFLRPLDSTAQSTAPPATDHRARDDWAIDARQPAAEPITEPIPVAAIHDRLPDAAEDFGGTLIEPIGPADRSTSVPIGTWKPDLIDRRRVGDVRPWYRTKAAATTLAAGVLAVIAVSSILLVLGRSEQTTSVTPQLSTTANPPPSNVQPTPSVVPSAAPSRPRRRQRPEPTPPLPATDGGTVAA